MEPLSVGLHPPQAGLIDRSNYVSTDNANHGITTRWQALVFPNKTADYRLVIYVVGARMTDSNFDTMSKDRDSVATGSDAPSWRSDVRLRQCLERIAGLAARALHCTAAICLLDGERLWFPVQTDNADAADKGSMFSGRVFQSTGAIVFENTSIGVPLRTATGEMLGALCLWGVTQEACGAEEQRTLADLAALAVCQIEAGAAKQGVDALQESRQRATHFMKHLPGLAFLKDLEHRYLYVNDKCREMFDEQITEWVGHTDDELWPQEIAAAFRDTDHQLMQTGQPQQTIDVFSLPDGPHEMLSTKFPIRDSHGAICMIGGISIDITEQKRTEHALHETENALRESRNRWTISCPRSTMSSGPRTPTRMK